MNRRQKILTVLASVALLMVVADHKSAAIWKLFELEEIDKSPSNTSWHLLEALVLIVCYIGLFYVLRSRSQFANLK